MENARKVIDNFEDLQIDEKYINEVFNGQPEYEDIPYYIKFDNYRGLWSDDLFRQYHNIMRQRLYICNLTKVYEEVYEKEQIDKYGIPNEMLEKYKSKTRYEIQMELGQKIDKLVNRDLVSKDTENDKLRLELLKRKLDNKEINKISDENLAEYASKLDIEITKNREILKNKKDLVSKT